ncbi:MAG: DUF2807 domain-containing protein [Cyclobacteriaceae bacterium]
MYFKYRKALRPSTLLLFSLLYSIISSAQPTTVEVGHFTKVIVSPHIELILEEGNEEKVTLENMKVNRKEVNVRVIGNTLRIYLDHAKTYTRQQKKIKGGNNFNEPYYSGTQLTARVSYKALKKLSIRGEEKATCVSEIKRKKFRLKVFGESDVEIAALEAQKMKTSLFGENKLKIESGSVKSHVLKAYGENKVKARGLKTIHTKTGSYGENEYVLNVTNELQVAAMGESEISYYGGAKLKRGLVIGENDIYEYIPVVVKN